jgi:hypothetical protein
MTSRMTSTDDYWQTLLMQLWPALQSACVVHLGFASAGERQTLSAQTGMRSSMSKHCIDVVHV